MNMRFGVCAGSDKVLTDRPIHADYLEIGASKLVKLEKEDFDALKRAVRNGIIRTDCANGLFPKYLRLTGDVDNVRLRDFCERVFYLLGELNVRTVVFGSGKAKAIPEGFSRERAMEQLYDLGVLLSDSAKQYGQTVVVEPLSFSEVNIINMTSEGAEYCRTVNRDNFKLLVDFYHFDNNNDDWQILGEVKDLLHHVHIASPKLRSIFESDADWAFCEKCLGALKEIGYDGNVSFEGKPYDSARLDEMILRMKKMV